MDKTFKINIEKKTLKNRFYRKVIHTTEQSQLVLMSIPPGDDIDKEKHRNTTQFIRVESGNGIAYVNHKKYILKDGDCLVIPPNTVHYIKNNSNKSLKLYTLYSPPEHPIDFIEKNH